MRRLPIFAHYDPKGELPLAGYATLVGFFGLAASGALWQARRRRTSSGFGVRDAISLGLATFQITRIIAKDRVLAPFRAPFTRYEKTGGAGELVETARGSGLQRAIGDLLTCPYCLAPWIAGALSFGLIKQPRMTRWLADVFTVVAISDGAQQGYAALKKHSP